MIDIQLKTGELWEIDGERHYLEQVMGGGFLLLRSERTSTPYQVQIGDGGVVSPTMAWLKAQIASGSARRIDAVGGSKARRIAERREDSFEAIIARDPRAFVRQAVLIGLDRMGHYSRSDQGLRRAVASIWKAKPLQLDKHRQPAPSTVRRWLNDRGAPGLRKLRSMTSMSSRVPRSLRLAPSIHRQMHRCAMAYWAERGTSIGEAYARLCTRVARINRWLGRHERRVLAVPSKESFRLHVRLTECWETVAAKYGPKEADKRFKACGKGLVSNRPLLLGAMDHTILDCFAVINAKGWRLLGRPTLTVLIDVHSRCIVGWVLSFEPPSLFAVMECIKRANRPKLHLRERYPDNPELEDIFGKFDEIVVDNGWEFSGTSFEAAMTDIGTTVRWAPTRSPTYKAVVERFFGTLNSMLNRKLPGATFPIAQLRAWELDPRKDAVLTLDQLEKLIWATISTYHLHQHRTLGAAPVRIWSEGVRECGIQVISDEQQLDKMAGAYETRTLSRSGVSIFNLQYHDPAITGPLLEKLAAREPVRGKAEGSARAKVTFKYNPANLGEIHVWDAPAGQFVTLPCVDPEYAGGLSLWRHQRISEWKREGGDERAAKEAESTIALKDAFEEAWPDGQFGRRKRTAARLLSSPRIEQLAGKGMRIAFAEPRHDGMAPIVPTNALANERSDDGIKPVRLPRGRKRKPAHSRPQQTSCEPETGAFPVFDHGGDEWKEFQ
ncbi:Mu transposase C-terminal domain-containing protein [Brevundimonas sp. EYE_349]|uniref:Mu transposase C-terminal domain-containing protein n=1 Tax=Brevundimonas sp. EYE_349 TaxID=2853455 RepID=UPI0020052749|nr:Mu transposase C-terminal domain-containing protein [Brevundimonas sp. EYE_349]MCK6104241.1 DDE-type integrase/transposase/recombinase [Brevundimonas sp. EYE_349]